MFHCRQESQLTKTDLHNSTFLLRKDKKKKRSRREKNKANNVFLCTATKTHTGEHEVPLINNNNRGNNCSVFCLNNSLLVGAGQ